MQMLQNAGFHDVIAEDRTDQVIPSPAHWFATFGGYVFFHKDVESSFLDTN